MGNKLVKDPIYEYIMVDGERVELINTPEFQRLRNIRQTSYAALYPSALHNRFVHSLGVFHLGTLAIRAFYKNSFAIISQQPKLYPNWEKIKNTFLTACLLHDVGHAPFSHTGEKQYTKGIYFDKALQEAVCSCQDLARKWKQPFYNKVRFCSDMKKSTVVPGAPHESMSALIGLELCRNHNVAVDPELFVRCIIGLNYQKSKNMPPETRGVLNALVGLLNGSVIDVDKLDYTIRDSYVTGYESLSIDLNRLLSAYTLYQENGDYYAGYRKGALSIIENVIYANDMERRWIQNHPTVLYDGMLVGSLLGRFDDHMRAGSSGVKTVFTKEALSQTGMQGLGRPLRLLSDADILAYAKNEDDSEVSRQYFDREKRLKPIWKTEAAFDPLFKRELTPQLLEEIQKDFQMCLDVLAASGEPFINQHALDYVTTKLGSGDKECKRAKAMCEFFQEFQKAAGMKDFQFALVLSKKFFSNYLKLEDSAIKVELDIGYFSLNDVLSVQANKTAMGMNKEFFYVYTTKDNLDGYRKYHAAGDLGKLFFDFLRRNYQHSAT